MSEQHAGDTGSKDRATVALVYRTVDDLGKLMTAEFTALNARLDVLARLPDQVASQHEMILLLQQRMLAVEQADALQESTAERQKREAREEEDRRRQYRRDRLPTLLLTAVATGAAVLAVFHPFG